MPPKKAADQKASKKEVQKKQKQVRTSVAPAACAGQGRADVHVKRVLLPCGMDGSVCNRLLRGFTLGRLLLLDCRSTRHPRAAHDALRACNVQTGGGGQDLWIEEQEQVEGHPKVCARGDKGVKDGGHEQR